VITAYDQLLQHFEDLRQQYPINKGLAVYNIATRSQQLRSDNQSQLTFNTTSNNGTTTSQAIDSLAEPDEQTTAEHHLSTNINLGWQKLEQYYRKLDDTPVYVAAVILHPRMKYRFLEKTWGSHHYEWLKAARLAFTELVLQYKDSPGHPTRPQHKRYSDDEDDVLSDDEPETGIERQLAAYEAEARHPHVLVKDSPIPYWLAQQQRWPQLAKLALDVFSTPVMSDEPERLFSETGAILSPRRRLTLADTIKHTMCLRQWRRRGLFTWTNNLFDGGSVPL
jgi:hypothetical protein